MKMSRGKFLEIKSLFAQALYKNKIAAKEIVGRTREVWQVWNFIFAEIAYDDSHPRFKGRDRQFKYNSEFELYPCGTNDKTLETALFKIVRELAKEEK